MSSRRTCRALVFSDAPDHSTVEYTFAHVADVMGNFTEQLGLKKFAIYIFDYGAPTGLRIALRFPARISPIITQNGNAYTGDTRRGNRPGNSSFPESKPLIPLFLSRAINLQPNLNHHVYIYLATGRI